MTKNVNDKDEFTLKDLFISIKEWLVYFKRKWLVLFVMAAIGGLLGFLYANRKPVYYEAANSFVLDDDQSSNTRVMDLSAYGFDMGDNDKGLFTNYKNIIWLYHSKLMLGTTLLSTVKVENKPVLLFDLFVKESHLEKSFNGVTFKASDSLSGLTRRQNEVMQSCVSILSSPKYLNVEEEKQAVGIINVKFKSKDEQFSKLFSDVLIKTVNEYYIETKTQKIADNISVLEAKMDSTKALLGRQSVKVASSVDNVPYANPNLTILRVAPEKERVDVEATKAMYLELARNLEGRKMILAQETPLIKQLDIADYPLRVIKASTVLCFLFGAFAGTSAAIIVLCILRAYRKIMA